jgi:hypothetical protein
MSCHYPVKPTDGMLAIASPAVRLNVSKGTGLKVQKGSDLKFKMGQ